VVVYLKVGRLYFTGPYSQINAIKEKYNKYTDTEKKDKIIS
jgi:hypothetical protein